MTENNRNQGNWVSDIIGDEFKQWRTKDKSANFGSYPTKVFIEAPTGSGKTYFILNKLLPYAAEQGRNILYLSNRTILEEQVKKQLGSILYEIEEKKDDMITYKIFPYPDKFASVTVLNYQAIVGFFKQGLYFNLQDKYYYVIFDEVHFFLEDALFNPYTEICLYKLFNLLFDSVKVFISATIEETKKLLDVIPPEDFKPIKSRFVYDLAKRDEKYYSAKSNIQSLKSWDLNHWRYSHGVKIPK